MGIEYPEFLEELLHHDRTLRAAVDNTVADFDIWLSTSRLPFFTDYTDHGIEHLNQVLATATSLITDQAWDYFTPADAAVLILATLLHDSALHLSDQGFHYLIKGNASHRLIEEFGNIEWPDLWDDFLFSAKRWDDRKLKDIFGESDAGQPLVTIRDPFMSYHNLTDADRKLIGEFIRLYHPRMAHEFAVFGVPGSSSDPIIAATNLDDDIRDIMGLIARSHGLPLRTCIEYLNNHYHRREYQNIHAVFIMVLLRVADFLQIQADRAPALVFRYRHIASHTSQLEWQAHDAITNITQTHDDPESIEIQAQPQDVKTFLRLKDWLAGIQEELDKSWAVLGEVYGSHDRLSNLGLILRRVRSNLDDVEEFSRLVDYVPQRIELSVARPDLLKLLVGPLYDNIPSIGIRELMQNAVDAVRERWALEDKYPELKDKYVALIPQENDVEIRLDEPDESGYAWFTISDRGVGMSAEIIRDYFLTAGASFRNSDAWKREYESDETINKSLVLRSGRFGVGILAGFLLGDRMEVSTRHIRSEVGIRFETTNELEAIELRYDSTLPIGTTIRMQVNPATYRELKTKRERVILPEYHEWFLYDKPSVSIVLDSIQTNHRSRGEINPEDFRRPSEWRKLRNFHGDYDVYWSFLEVPNLSVNGIFVTKAARRLNFPGQSSPGAWDNSTASNYTYSLRHPKICVQDPDAKFPLNLRRNDIVEKNYSFANNLINDTVDDFLAYLIVNCPNKLHKHEWISMRRPPNITVKGGGSTLPTIPESVREFQVNKFVNASSEGIAIFGSGLLKDGSPLTICLAFSNDLYQLWQFINSSDTRVIFSSEIAKYFQNVTYDSKTAQGLRLLNILDLLIATSTGGLNLVSSFFDSVLAGYSLVTGARALVPLREVQKIQSPVNWLNSIHESRIRKGGDQELSTEERIQEIRQNVQFDFEVGQYVLLKVGSCPKTTFDLDLLNAMPQEELYAIEIFVDPSQKTSRSTYEYSHDIFAKRWHEIIQYPVIPFDLQDRRDKLSYAYRELAPFIEAHQTMKEQGILA